MAKKKGEKKPKASPWTKAIGKGNNNVPKLDNTNRGKGGKK